MGLSGSTHPYDLGSIYYQTFSAATIYLSPRFRTPRPFVIKPNLHTLPCGMLLSQPLIRRDNPEPLLVGLQESSGLVLTPQLPLTFPSRSHRLRTRNHFGPVPVL